MLTLIDNWMNDIDSGKIIGSVFLDLRKLLTQLIMKFYYINCHYTDFLLIEYKSLDLIYQTDNTYTVYNNCSELKTIRAGVPQGSILRPFLIYTNDLALEPLKCNLDMYADDGTFHSSDVSIKSIELSVQHDLTIVDKWCTLNNTAINPSKTVCMTIGPQRKLSKLIELSLSVQCITSQLRHIGY